MAKPALRSVPNDVDLGDEFAVATQAEVRKESQLPSVRSMIAESSKALRAAVDRMRKKEAEIEEQKALAAAQYEQTVALAKHERDETFANADADLHQLRTTLNVLDPARAKLAETA